MFLGSGDLTVTQSTDSSFGGTVSGTKNFVKQGNGTLTLSNSSPLAGSLVVSNGTLSVTAALPGLAGANVASAGTLAGTGTVSGSISDAGTLSPGTGGAGSLSVGSTSFIINGIVAIDLLGTNVGEADKLAVTGAIALHGSEAVVERSESDPRRQQVHDHRQ